LFPTEILNYMTQHVSYSKLNQDIGDKPVEFVDELRWEKPGGPAREGELEGKDGSAIPRL
jgi:hypothetical protein